MQIVRGLHNIRDQHRGSVLTIGNFDGVHLGHRLVIAHLNAKRDALGAPSTLLTFEPQPREFFQGRAIPPRLTRFREKMVLLSRTGLDHVICLPFNERMASLSAQEWIEDFLVRRLGVRFVVLGDDSRFGRDRGGDYALVRGAAERFGFGASHLGTLSIEESRVSSTRIRDALATGDFATAEELLGHRYFVMGHVVYGRQLGRQLGIPTANLRLGRYKSPLAGVFVVEVELAGRHYRGIANVGVRPTIGGTEPLVEAHLFDFGGDLYGKLMTVTFRARIRDEQTFSGLDALKTQILLDCAQAREWLRADAQRSSTPTAERS